MFSEPAYGQRFRTAVRGNATLFELPLEDVFREIEVLEKVAWPFCLVLESISSALLK
jgi:hypothetical protein